MITIMNLTPQKARIVARMLQQTADKAESRFGDEKARVRTSIHIDHHGESKIEMTAIYLGVEVTQ